MVKRKRSAPKIAKLESNEIAEDRISEMPPDILISILSSLPMGDAVSTSVLSSRWRGLWKRSILDLNFDAAIMRGSKSYKNYKCRKVTLRVIHQQMRDFVRRVNQFLLLHQVTKIATFRKLPKFLPTFHHLKHLMLTVHTPNDRRILWMTDLLRASPFLQKFQLAVYADGGLDKEEKELMRLPKCPHNHLKTVELGGFRGDPNEMEVAVYILNNCVALETMLIDPRPQGICIYSNTWVVYGRARKAWSKFRREKVKEQLLKEEVGKSVEVILL